MSQHPHHQPVNQLTLPGSITTTDRSNSAVSPMRRAASVLRRISGALLLLTVGLTVACQGNRTEQEASSKGTAGESAVPTKPAIPAAWRAEDFAGSLRNVRTEAGRVTLDVTLPASAPLPDAPPVGFNFCLPDQPRLAVKVLKYSVGDKTVPVAGSADQPATGTAHSTPAITPTATPSLASRPLDPGQAVSLQRKGWFGHWPIWRLNLNSEFWRPAREMRNGALPSTKQPAKDLTVTLEIALPASPAPAATGLKLDSPLAQTARELVANPEGIDHWGATQSPVRADLTDEPTDPRPLAKGSAGWGRITVTTDSLYRLTPQSLAAAQLDGVAVKGGVTDTNILKEVRIFAQGKPVPTRLVQQGNPATDGLYFYGWKGRTPYDHSATYWVAVTDGPAGPTWPEGMPAPVPATTVIATSATAPATSATLTTGGALTPLSLIERTSRLRRDNELKIEHGNFLTIAGLTWVDAKLATDAPIVVPIQLDHPILNTSTQTLNTRFKFYFSGKQASAWNQVRAELRHGDQKLAELHFTDAAQAEQRVALPATLFAGGMTTLTLVTTSSTAAEGDPDDGVWFMSAEVSYPAQPTLPGGRLTLDRDAVTTPGLYRLALPGAADRIAVEVDPKNREVLAQLPLTGDAITFDTRNDQQAEIYDLAAVSVPQVKPQTFADAALAGKADDGQDGVDYLVITHPDFRAELAPLLTLNKERGLRTKVVEIQALYDLFSHGALSPAAIRAYLAYAARHWPGGGPSYVLLVGDCTSDYLDETRSGVRNFVPTYTYANGSDKWASDLWLACLTDDDLPDVMLGRLSVNTPQMARAEVAKIVRYAKNDTFGPWRGRLAYIADNGEGFREAADELRTTTQPPAFEARRIYLDELPMEDNWYVPTSYIERIWAEEKNWMKVSGEATNRVRALFDDGVTVLSFFGHGSPNIWTDERIWFGGDSPNRDSQFLKSDGRYAFIVNYTCNTGAIDYPTPHWNVCITEDLMAATDGGAIGAFVPSGPGTTPVHEKMGNQWNRALFEDNERTFGRLATLTRARYALEETPRDLLYMIILLGDPALDLHLTRRWVDLKVDPPVAAVGQGEVTATLDQAQPAHGKAQAWVEDEHGHHLWEGQPFDYQGGQIRLKVPVASFATSVTLPARLRVGLYGWNAASKADFAAGGELKLDTPEVAIIAAQAKRGGDRPDATSKLGFEITLANKSELPEAGIKVRVRRADDQAAAPLAEQTVTLGPKETQSITLTGATPVPIASGEPAIYVAEAALPVPPLNLAQSQTLTLRMPVLPGPNWVGLAPGLGAWQQLAANSHVQAIAVSQSKPEGHWFIRRLPADGDRPTSTTVTFTEKDGLYFTSTDLAITLPVRPAVSQSATRPTTGTTPTSATTPVTAPPTADPSGDMIELVKAGEHGSGEQVVSRATLGTWPRRAPRLRIKPGSIHHAPANPTDGQTIFVSFEVENMGDAPSLPLTPALLDKSPREGGRELGNLSGLLKPQIPALGPGRSWPLTLRWDPMRNAGVQKIWVSLPGAQVDLRDDQALKEEVADYSFYVRSKAQLRRLKAPWVTRSAEDIQNNRYKLHVEVTNEGETEARGVEVFYYRNADKKESNLIGTVPLAVVPAKGKADAVLDVANLNPNDHPVVEIRLKGSAQRITE